LSGVAGQGKKKSVGAGCSTGKVCPAVHAPTQRKKEGSLEERKEETRESA